LCIALVKTRMAWIRTVLPDQDPHNYRFKELLGHGTKKLNVIIIRIVPTQDTCEINTILFGRLRYLGAKGGLRI